ncbi:MAG: tRNA 2-thiocytidine(32) synthetase TtcA [Clostridia bacterium]|nr:tRNA 2-thiocytidine(32) synthetase TtcA [Clostridia bacterium]
MTTQQMLSRLRRGISEYQLIRDGDKIAVGVSGGKDSVTLLKLLAEYQKFSPEKFELIAITVDLKFNKKPTDFSPIKTLCNSLGVKYYIESTDIGEIVFDLRKESNPCALCSKMRKGALYSKVKELGFNKIAIGHHSDDLIDTFLLSLFYEGRLSTFAPKSYLSKSDITLIRPMIMVKESEVTAYSKNLPIVDSCCPANKQTKREYVKNVISDVAKEVKNVREMMFTALTHSERYNLFDKFDKQIDEI